MWNTVSLAKQIMAGRLRTAGFARNRAGNVALVTAIAAVPLVVATGGVVDYSRSTQTSVDFQVALDAAVLAAVSDPDLSTDDALTSFVSQFVDSNFSGGCSESVAATWTDDVATATGSCAESTAFLKVIGIDEFTINRSASARWRQASPPCVITLSPTDANALSLNSGSTIDATACAVHVNSTSASAAYLNSASSLDAQSTCIVGDDSLNLGSAITPTAMTGCMPIADPYAPLAEPASADDACDRLDYKPAGSATISPGVYCGTTEIDNAITVTMMPGTYVFRGGPLIINSGGTLTGNDVTLYFHDKDSYLVANSGSMVRVDGPDDGAMEGFVVVQNGDIAPGDAQPFLINSGSSSYFEGVFYTPSSALQVNSNSSVNAGASYSIFAVRALELNSMSELDLAADYVSGTPLPRLAGVSTALLVD